MPRERSAGECFGAVLRRHRQSAGLSQLELAARAEISVAAIRDLEQGRSRTPRSASVRALASALGLAGEQAAGFRQAAHVPLTVASRPAPAAADDSSEAPEAGFHDTFRIAVLGPLSVGQGATVSRLGAGQHRRVLARLALSPNSTVSREDIVDLLWGEHPPPSALNMIQQAVARLRRILEPQRSRRGGCRALTLMPGGYRLNVDATELDLVEYRELTARAQIAAGNPPIVRELLGRALDLWRDEALVDMADLQSLPTLIALAEERITLTVRYAQLSQDRSWHEHCLPRLRALAVGNPLHEPLHGQLIAMLASTSRQADALATYAAIRRRLRDDLGVDPGPDLVQTFQGVLRQRYAPPRSSGPAHPLSSVTRQGSGSSTDARRHRNTVSRMNSRWRGEQRAETVPSHGC